ncbi:hypothetical protein DB31_7168 [Hyalangium minutum]|uniref:Uncharacterized protein n=1 Tax=Hyalangium minutum TaxID=394096 RepID=A0A085WJR8_9BACT|nr:hypothetical protein DB31_7168 [Hyalangium minutum]
MTECFPSPAPGCPRAGGFRATTMSGIGSSISDTNVRRKDAATLNTL